jgi:hypothetical protein
MSILQCGQGVFWLRSRVAISIWPPQAGQESVRNGGVERGSGGVLDGWSDGVGEDWRDGLMDCWIIGFSDEWSQWKRRAVLLPIKR